jgi:hypothetical protein
MIIDNTKPEFDDVPNTLNDEVLLDRPAQGGFITCPQETAYMFAIATAEQQQYAGHDKYDYTGLNLAIVNKPNIPDVAAQYAIYAQELIDSLTIPEPAKIGLQNRIDGLLIAMNNAASLDDALRLALQLPIDIINT